jgi:hypothetical protein
VTGVNRVDLNDLLLKKKIDPQQVLVFRHRPPEPKFNKVLKRLASERPDFYNAYQQTQSSKVEKAMIGAAFIASFIGHESGKALFVGLYKIGPSRPLTFEEYWQVPAYIEMKKRYELKGWTEDEGRASVLWFDLVPTDFYASWKGRLIVEWPPPGIAWWRRAHKNVMPVLAIAEESLLDPSMPDWREIVLDWEELGVLSPSWKSQLAQWRAIYYIVDTSDGKGYVGSAYGSDNLLGRWLTYFASGHGGNSLLRERDQKHFRFSILQRLDPDAVATDVIQLENTWKKRLRTRSPDGLNDN